MRAAVAQLDHVEDRYGSRWQPGWVLGVKVPSEGSRHGRHRRPRGHRALSRAAGPVVPPAHEKAAARAGKIAKRTARGVVSRHGLRPVRTSRTCGKALSAKQLAIRAGRPGPQRRTAGRAGATPPKTALACAAGPFGEVAPETYPCRKAARPQGREGVSRRLPDRLAELTGCANLSRSRLTSSRGSVPRHESWGRDHASAFAQFEHQGNPFRRQRLAVRTYGTTLVKTAPPEFPVAPAHCGLDGRGLMAQYVERRNLVDQEVRIALDPASPSGHMMVLCHGVGASVGTRVRSLGGHHAQASAGRSPGGPSYFQRASIGSPVARGQLARHNSIALWRHRTARGPIWSGRGNRPTRMSRQRVLHPIWTRCRASSLRSRRSTRFMPAWYGLALVGEAQFIDFIEFNCRMLRQYLNFCKPFASGST